MENYAVLYLKEVPENLYDEVCGFLFEEGAQGVSETLKFIQESQQYDPEIIPTETVNLEAYFLPKNLDLDKLKLSFSDYTPTIKMEEGKDWMSEWKKHFRPFSVTQTLWVYPSWIEPKEAEEVRVIKIDPGLAFGTGTHATTLLCMRKIEELFSSKALNSVLDVGAGTGILAILCHMLGFKNIKAVEIDEMAREKCVENFEINAFTSGLVLSPEETDYTIKNDLVIANIIDGVLLKIKEDLVSATGENLILSGILRENEEDVLKAFLGFDLDLISKEYLDEWCLLHFKKRQ